LPRPLVIFLHSADWPSRYQAASLAVTAAAFGGQVYLALFFGALCAWVEGRFDEGAPPEAARTGVGSLRDMLEEGRRELSLEVVACDTAVRLAGLPLETARSTLDRVVGLPELWRLAQSGQALSL
jgi:peroxiredoxin family protein